MNTSLVSLLLITFHNRKRITILAFPREYNNPWKSYSINPRLSIPAGISLLPFPRIAKTYIIIFLGLRAISSSPTLNSTTAAPPHWRRPDRTPEIHGWPFLIHHRKTAFPVSHTLSETSPPNDLTRPSKRNSILMIYIGMTWNDAHCFILSGWF